MPDYEGERRQIDFQYCNTDDNSSGIEAIAIGPINKHHIPFVPNHNPHQMLQGFYKRVAHQHYKPDKEFLAEFYQFVGQQIIQLEPLPPIPFSEELLEEWLADYSHPEGRKNQIRNAYARREDHQLMKKDYRCKMFGKREFYNDYKYERMINPRSDEFIAQVGPYIHKIDDYLFHHSPLAKHFIKGMTPEEMIASMDARFKGHSLFIETDYSSFEGSYTVDYQKHVEFALFKHLLKNNPHVLKLIKPCYSSNGPNNKVFNPFLSASFSGSRMSGDLWTSSMNGFSNLMNMMFLCKKCGVSADGYVEGDDGLFAVNKGAITSEHYSKLGFNIKLDYQTAIEDCAFCQKIFHPDTKTLLGPPILLNKAGWTAAKKYFQSPERVHHELYKAVCMSYLSLYNNCPVIGPFFQSQLQHLENYKYRYEDNWWKNEMKRIDKKFSCGTIDMRDRLLYEKRFGITIEHQLQFEQWAVDHPGEDFELEFPGVKSYSEGLVQIVDV